MCLATASYRLLPEITLTKEIEGEMAERLQSCFSPGVIGLEDNGSGEYLSVFGYMFLSSTQNLYQSEHFLSNLGRKRATVLDARYDSCSRNVYRHDDLKDSVKMARVKDHFICEFLQTNLVQNGILYKSLMFC